MAEVGFDGTEENGVSSVAEKGGQLSPELKKKAVGYLIAASLPFGHRRRLDALRAGRMQNRRGGGHTHGNRVTTCHNHTSRITCS